MVKTGRIRWFGHVERRGNVWVIKCTDFKVDGCAWTVRPKKSWLDCVNDDMKKVGFENGAGTC